VVKATYRVTVNLTAGMLRQLDQLAARLNISRQAVISTLLDKALATSRTSGETNVSVRPTPP